MSENEASLHGVLARLAADERRRLGDEVSVDELLAYRRGELDEAAAERVRDLLAADPAWAEIYLDLGRLEALAAEADDVSEAEIERGWRALEAEIAPRGRLLRFRNALARRVASHPLSAMAASFLLASVGTWFLRPSWPLQPAIGAITVVELLSEQHDSQLRGRPAMVAVDPGGEKIVLRLEPPPEADLLEPPPARCRFEIRRGENVVATGEAPAKEGAYALEIPPGALPAGSYEIRLLDPELAGAAPFAIFRFELREVR